MTIKERMVRIVTMKNRLTQELHALQKACPHIDKTGVYGSNTGNYDPSADCYWISVNCHDCGRTWSIYSDEPGYRGFDGRIDK